MTDTATAQTPPPTPEPARPAGQARAAFDSMKLDAMDGMIPVKASAVGKGEEAPANGEVSGESEKPPEAPPPPPPPVAPGKLLDTRVHKTIKAFFDEGDPAEYREDAKIEYKVNGQTVIRPLREILERQSGVENTDRYWAEFQKADKNFKDYLGNIVQQTKAGKGLEAIVQAIADQGHDPVEFTKNLRVQLADGVSKWSQLPEGERKALELEEENNYYKTRLEQQAKLTKAQQEQVTAQTAVKDMETRYGIPEGTWQEYYGILNQEQQAGRFPAREITLEDVGKFYKGSQDYQTITKALSEVAPSVAGDREVISLLHEAVSAGRISYEELPDIIRASYGEPEVPVVSNGSNAGKAERNVSEKILQTETAQSLASKTDRGTVKSPIKRPRDLW